MSTLSDDQLKSLKEAVLNEKIAYLCDELGDPGRYFPELRSKSILGTMDTETIRSKTTDRERTEQFVTFISKRRDINGHPAFDAFVDALRKQRVHAHVARTLVRAFNKKKAEAERTSTPSITPIHCEGGSNSQAAPMLQPTNNFIHTPSSDDRMSTGSSQLEVHPEHGVLPPSLPPPRSLDDPQPNPPEVDSHPQYGMRPPPPPTTTNSRGFISPEEEGMLHRNQFLSASNGHHSGYMEPPPALSFNDELGAQSMGYTDTSLSTMSTEDGSSYSTGDFERNKAPPSRTSSATSTASRSSYPSLGNVDDLCAEVDKLRKAHEIDKFEKKQLEQQLQVAKQRIQALELENRRLNEQLYHHRPSNLHFGGAVHHQFSAGTDYNSLTPSSVVQPGRQRHISPSPGPVGERESPGLRSAVSSGSLNFQSTRGNYFTSESRV